MIRELLDEDAKSGRPIEQLKQDIDDPKGFRGVLEAPRKSPVFDSRVSHQEWIVGEVEFRS
jgi:hypothetical protein